MKATLERVYVEGMHIRTLTARNLRNSIAADRAVFQTAAKSIQYKTELLKLIKRGKNLGQSATDADILKIMRRCK